jgi:hypothetical protein
LVGVTYCSHLIQSEMVSFTTNLSLSVV